MIKKTIVFLTTIALVYLLPIILIGQGIAREEGDFYFCIDCAEPGFTSNPHIGDSPTQAYTPDCDGLDELGLYNHYFINNNTTGVTPVIENTLTVNNSGAPVATYTGRYTISIQNATSSSLIEGSWVEADFSDFLPCQFCGCRAMDFVPTNHPFTIHVENKLAWESTTIDVCSADGIIDLRDYIVNTDNTNLFATSDAMNLPIIGGIGGYQVDVGAAPLGSYTLTAYKQYQNRFPRTLISVVATLRINDPPTVNAGLDLEICDGVAAVMSTSITGNEPFTYSWSPTTGITFPNTQNPNITPTSTTIFSLTVTARGGCSSSDDIQITVTPNPVADAGPNSEICIGSSVQLAGSGNGGSGSLTYNWQPAAGLSNANILNPIASPSITTLYSLVVTDSKGCSASDNLTIIVNPTPIVEAGGNTSVCINATPFLPGGSSPANGNWSGNGVTANIFNPASAGVGIHILTYTFSDVNGCSNSAPKSVTVNDLPTVDAGTLLEGCISDLSLVLSGESPAGGTWSGITVTGNIFNPSSAGIGDHIITYTYTNGNGCTNSDPRTVRVNALPLVEAGTNINICITAAAVNLNGFSPFGGNWTGPGLIGPSTFDPSVAGVGDHILTYTYTDGNGCSDADNKTVTVNDITPVTFGPNLVFCFNYPIYNLNNNVDIIGGTFSGNGVSGVNLNPNSAGIGTHVLTYTYTNANGCVSIDNTTIDVVATPVLTFANSSFDQCINEGMIDLNSSGPTFPGGTWSGAGVSGSNFDPVMAGLGLHLISYDVSSGGCEVSGIISIDVHDFTVVDAGSNLEVCEDDAAFILTGASRPGGLWSGAGVGGDFFDPSAVVPGIYTVTYTYTTGEGCESTDTRNVTVNSKPVVDAGADFIICLNATLYPLINDVNITGGSFTGNGVSGLNFRPSTAGLGTHSITYTYVDPTTGCFESDFRLITVIAPDVVTVGPDQTICINDATVDLTIGVSKAGGTWSGPGVTLSIFDPASAGVGIHDLIYTVTDGNGCIATAIRVITVEGLPVVESGADIFICDATPIVGLDGTGTPIGGVWSGPFVAGNIFDVSMAGPGNYTITYTYTSPNGCLNSDTKSIIVDGGTVVGAGPDFAVCESDALVDLASRVTPGGGDFTGPGISGNNFNPDIGPGSYTINYSLANEFGCVGTDDFVVTVNTDPNVFAGTNNTVCLNGSPTDLSLTASPVGGIFSGPGVSGVNFDPLTAGVGNQLITYTFTNGSGCSGVDTREITVTPLPEVSAGSNEFICIGNGLIDLDADVDPPGGSWSGTGINAGIFNAANAGIGTHILTYTITFGNGCSSFDNKVIVVETDPVVDAGFVINTCTNSGVVNLTDGVSDGGGVWSGIAVTGSNFYPAESGPGSFSINYIFTNEFGCVATDSRNIVVTAPQVVSVGSDISVCITAPSIDLSTSVYPTGGTFIGTGVIGTDFQPLLAGFGAHTITYQVADINGCIASNSRVITVVDPDPVDAGDNLVLCLSNGLVDLNASANPTGGTWSGNGVSGSFFDPLFAGTGTHTIAYTVDHGVDCFATDSRVILVRDDITADAGPNLVFCTNDGNYDLTNDADKTGGIWSGPGIDGNTFRPSVANVGDHTLTYGYTDIFGCFASDSRIFTVNSIPTVNAGPDREVCVTYGLLDLTTSVFPAGGEWTGPGVSGNSFNTGLVGVGEYQLTYTFLDAFGCENSDMLLINVVSPEAIDAGSNEVVCLSSGIMNLDLGVSPTGGNWSGPGIIFNQFDPFIAGIGTYLLTYIIDDGSGCISTASKTISVNPDDIVSAGNDLVLCINDAPHDLTNDADKLGGVWSGTGIEGNVFNPISAGMGSHVITYSYTNGFGCVAIDSRIFTVYDLPVVDAGPALEICVTSPTVDLDAAVFPSGGTWSGAGIIGSIFNPGLVDVGSYSLVYTYTDGLGCENSDVKQVEVVYPGEINAGANQIVCLSSGIINLDLNVNITGGTWTGTAVSSNQFDPSFAGEGSFILTYTFDDGSGCISTDNRTITVRNDPLIDAGEDKQFCINDNLYDLTNDPSELGGIWSGPGVIGNSFDPVLASFGSHTLTYIYTDPFGCQVTDTKTVNVLDIPPVSAGSDISVCEDAEPLDLNQEAFPSGGLFFGNGLISNIFYPSIAGPGDHELIYTYSDVNGCTNSDIRVITVHGLPVVDAGSSFDICVNANPIELNAATPADGVWSGPGIIAGVFDPLSAGIGTDTLIYSYTDDFGCFNSDEIVVTVLKEPELFMGDALSMCLSDNPKNLLTDVNINGGEFDGVGITGILFIPTDAGPGTHIISYTVRFNGCNLITYREIAVNESSPVDIGEDLILCISSEPFNLIDQVNLIGGTFNGNGVIGNIFYPEDAGLGPHLIGYAYINGFGCESRDTRIINVQEQLPIFAGNDLSICNSISSFDLNGYGTPVNGLYVGMGVANNIFDPSISGLGDFTIKYIVNNGNGCISEDSLVISITESEISDFGQDDIVCIDSDPLELNFSQELQGGIWSGEGVVNNFFYPTLAEIGKHTLNYSNSGLECEIGGLKTITVVGLPQPASSELKTIEACSGEFISLNATINEEDRANDVSVAWFKEAVNDPFDYGENINYEINTNEKIFYEAESSFGCRAGQNNFITLRLNNPSGRIESGSDKILFGKAIQFFAREIRNTVSYEWDFGDGNISFEKNPYHYYYESDSFDIALILKSSEGCETTIIEENLIYVLPEEGRTEGDPITGLDEEKTEWANSNGTSSIVTTFPNPTDKTLSLEFKIGKPGEFQSYLAHPSGKQLIKLKRVFLSQGYNKVEFDISLLKPGLYTIILKSKFEIMRSKFVKI